MRVLLLDVHPWEDLAIVRALQRAGMTPLRERDAREMSVVLVSERAAGELPQLQSEFPNARILILGGGRDNDAVAELVSNGADGYFDMSLGNAKLVSAINVVARGSFWLPDKAVAPVMKRLRAVPESVEALNPSEQSIVGMLHEGLTDREMAARLQVAEITVRTRLSRLYRRFHVRTRAQLVTELRGRGFIPPQ